MKLAKVNKLFLTGTGAEEHAGLSGLTLTLSALGSPALEVFGASGVDKLVVRKSNRKGEQQRAASVVRTRNDADRNMRAIFGSKVPSLHFAAVKSLRRSFSARNPSLNPYLLLRMK